MNGKIVAIKGLGEFTSVTDGALTVYEFNGQRLAGGLFKMYDERGFPLWASLEQCRKHNLIPCLKEFVCDAMKAGWTREKAERMIEEAKTDSR